MPSKISNSQPPLDKQGKIATLFPQPIAILDPEVIDAINQLAEQQRISPALALKKAIATATYLYDVTTNQKGTILIKRPDKSISEVTLK